MTTTYTYTYGLLTLTDYSDATPDVAITYDPLGRQSTITTAVAKSEFTYDPATLAVDTEVISYNLDATAGYEFFRVLDRSRDALGRDTGFILGSTPAPGVGGGAPASTIVEAQAAYAYSPTDGRIAQISNPQISNQTFSYAYSPNSSLLATVTGPIHTVINSYEPTRDVLDTKTNKLAITVISKYDYAVNAIGQRTGVATSGTVFPAVPSWLWSYDALGQVIAADSSIATSDRAYQYDAIGNRIQARDGITTATGTPNYTANRLNQYTSFPSLASVPSYDFDGNMTSGPLPVSPTTNSTLLWDAENRLNEVKNAAGTILEKNLFDAGSRKIATTANGITTLYLYDGWNCIAEYTRSVGVSPTLQKTRLWGTDLSGTLQGAGGVGGILSESSQITSNPITFNSSYPTYDGNGNVSEYLDSTGQVTAHFEYDAFGNTVVNTDTSNQFAYRFSTKPLAFATGLYYYGYRYYDPMTGRWPSRDPIEEEGGVNLYGFVGNDGVNRWDYLGFFAWEETGRLQASATVSPFPIFLTLGGKLIYYKDTSGSCCKKVNINGDITYGGGASVRWSGGIGFGGAKATLGIKGTFSLAENTNAINVDVIFDCADKGKNSTTAKTDLLKATLGMKAELSGSVYVQLGKFRGGFEDASVRANFNGDIKAWVDINMDRRTATLKGQTSLQFGAIATWRGHEVFNHNILEDVDTGEIELYKYSW